MLTKQHIQINSFSFIIVSVQKCCITWSTAGGCKELQWVLHWLLSDMFQALCVVPCNGGIECGCCSWQRRGTDHTGPGGKKRTFLCLDQRAQGDSMLKQSRKLIGYTYLVHLCLFGPLLFPSLHH